MIKLNVLLTNAERFTTKTTKTTLIALRKWFRKQAASLKKQSDIKKLSRCDLNVITNNQQQHKQKQYTVAEEENHINEHRVSNDELVEQLETMIAEEIEENPDHENLRNEWREILGTLDKYVL